MKLFNPLSSIVKSFTINYDERLWRETEQELYLAKDSVIKAAVQKANIDSVLSYQQERVRILQDALDKMKGEMLEKASTNTYTSAKLAKPISP